LLARVDDSFESMRRFVAGASHELRTPIAVIRGEADVALSHDRGAAEYQESLAIVLDESRRLSRLVDDLLNLARRRRPRQTRGAGILFQRADGGMLPLHADPGERFRCCARMPFGRGRAISRR
jgi:signal transduction histidine kinase